jgi:hypothetical protein
MSSSTTIARFFHQITPSDSAEPAPFPIRGIYVAATGNLVVQDEQFRTTTFAALPAGVFVPISPRRVLTATTGTHIALGT